MSLGVLPAQALDAVPEILRSFVEDAWRSFSESQGDNFSCDDEVLASLCKVWACSDFVSKTCLRDVQILPSLVETGDLQRGYERALLGVISLVGQSLMRRCEIYLRLHLPVWMWR